MEPFAPRLWAYEISNSVLMGLRRGASRLAIREGAQLARLDDALCKAAVRAGIFLYEIGGA
jgi:hypothetical protein